MAPSKASKWERAVAAAFPFAEAEARILGPWTDFYKTSWQTSEDTTVATYHDTIYNNSIRHRQEVGRKTVVQKKKLYKHDVFVAGHGNGIKIRTGIASEIPVKSVPGNVTFQRFKTVYSRQITDCVRLDLSFVSLQGPIEGDLAADFAETGHVPNGVTVEFEAEFTGQGVTDEVEDLLRETLLEHLEVV